MVLLITVGIHVPQGLQQQEAGAGWLIHTIPSEVSSPSPSASPRWDTFSHSSFPVEFSYPPYLYVYGPRQIHDRHIPIVAELSLLPVRKRGQSYGNVASEVNFAVYLNPKSLTSAEWAHFYTRNSEGASQLNTYFPPKQLISTNIVAGVSVVRISYQHITGDPAITTLLPIDDKMVNITYLQRVDDNIEADYDRIIASLSITIPK